MPSLIISISVKAISYVSISSTTFCGHTSGGLPSYCYLGSGYSEDNCASLCTSNSACIAYASSENSGCYIITATQAQCSVSGGSFSSNTVATSIDQLGTSSVTGYSCMGKILGNNKHRNNTK